MSEIATQELLALQQAIEQSQEEDELSVLGRNVGKWQLRALLGEGGMSSVYLAKHEFLQQFAAIKFLKGVHSKHSSDLVRFQQEALAISSVSHRNVIRVLDFGKDPIMGSYMILEYLQGQDLQEIIDGMLPPYPTDWLHSVLGQLCQGLSIIHQAGIIHRDLKPSNIFLLPKEPYPQVKILDFGVAKIKRSGKPKKLTETGMVVGTPAYLAPEQILQDSEVTTVADIYSLGVLVYECLTGRLPIESDNNLGLLVKVCKDKPTPLGHYRPDLAGTKLEAFFDRALAKHPRDRAPDVRSFWQELEPLLPEAAHPKYKYPTIQISSEAITQSLQPLRTLLDHTELPDSMELSGTTPTIGPVPSSEDETLAEVVFAEEPFELIIGEPELYRPKQAQEEQSAAEKPKLAPSPLPEGEIVEPEKVVEPTKEEEPSSAPFPWGILLVVLAVCLAFGAWTFVQRTTTPTAKPKRKTPKTLIASHRAKQQLALDQMVIQGRKAFQKKDIKSAIKLWKKAIARSGWKKSHHYPRLYKAVGIGMIKSKELYQGVMYYRLYQKGVLFLQKRLAALKQKLSGLVPNTDAYKETLKQLEKVSSSIVKQEQFQRENGKIEELEQLLKQKRKASLALLKSLNKSLQATQWKKSVDLYHKITTMSPNDPMTHRLLAQALKPSLPSVAAHVMRQLTKNNITDADTQTQLDATQKDIELQLSKSHNRWKSELEQASLAMKQGKTRAALRKLQSLLKDDSILSHRISLGLEKWLALQSRQHPFRIAAFWYAYAKKIKKLEQKGLLGWLTLQRAEHKKAAQLQRQATHFYRLSSSWTQAKEALEKGQLSDAHKGFRGFLYHHKKIAANNTLSDALAQQRKYANSWSYKLKQLVSLKEKAEQAYRIADFPQAQQHQQALLQMLQKAPCRHIWQKRISALETRAKRATQQLKLGQQQYSQHKWTNARRHFKAYIALFPQSNQLTALKQKLKVCRCMMKIFPWERCSNIKLPTKQNAP